LLQLVDFPGAKVCKQKTWINDCGTTLVASISGAVVTYAPTITGFDGKPCRTVQGMVVGPRQVLASFPEYPLAQVVTNPDNSVSVQFSAWDDGDTSCYATYRLVQGSYLNGTFATAGPALGLPGTGAAGGSATSTGAADPLKAFLAANSASAPSLLISTVLALACAFALLML